MNVNSANNVARVISFWLQDNGIDVIPNIVWGLENTYDFCFDGIPNGGTVAISTNGCIKDKTDRYYFKKGLGKMIELCNQKTLLFIAICRMIYLDITCVKI